MHIVSSVSGDAARRTSARWTRCARSCRPGRCQRRAEGPRDADHRRARAGQARRLRRRDRLPQLHRRPRHLHPHPHRRRQGRRAPTSRPAAAPSPTRKPDYEFEESEAKARAVLRAVELALRAAGLAVSTRVLVVDNYDSFTYNLVQYLGELGARARRRAQRPRDGRRAARARGPTASSSRRARARPTRPGSRSRRCAASPRPACRRSASASATSRWPRRSAARVVRHVPVHGKTTTIEHDGRTIFRRPATSPLTVGRYHSLVVDEDDAARLPSRSPPAAAASSWRIRHRELPAEGVQFHPESVLTDDGQASCSRNFLG